MLERFARLRLQPDDPAAQALLEKLDKARILRVETIAADIATLGSRVVFSVDDGRPEARVLVLPAQHAAAGWTLPVTTPRGMALLGRAAGATVTAARHDGTTERLHVLDVIHQPEAAAATAAAAMRGEGDRPGRTALPHPAAGGAGGPETGGAVPPRRPREGSALEPG
jgi:regulator of nucleoside diphosphate kinase